MTPIKTQLKNFYRSCQHSRLRWQLKNWLPILQYYQNKPKLSGAALGVIRDLNLYGIALIHVKDVLRESKSFQELKEAVEQREAGLQEEIESARKKSGEVLQEKSFRFDPLDKGAPLPADNLYRRFASLPILQQIAEAYFQMKVRLAYYAVWHNLATLADPQRSQLWHRDQEDHHILKIFLYLNDVDEGAGPFLYAPGTHPKGKIKKEPEAFREPGHGNPRSTDEQMEKIVPSRRWVKAVGPAGTIVFADTRGYHKGGYATVSERLLYVCMFTSPSYKGSYEV